MANLIKNEKIAADSWLRLELSADGSLPAIPAAGDILVPLALWQVSERELLLRTDGRMGIWLDSDEDPAQIANNFGCFDVIAVNFPHFTDGRGYSIARLLRERHGWKGELRAIGDVQRDQLFYLARCGFDAFLLNDGEDASQGDSLRSVPQEDLLRGVPQEDSLRSVPQEDLLRGVPQEDLLRGVPQEDLLRGVPQEDLLRGAQAAVAALSDFSEAYQTSVERPLPLFRRRETQIT